MSGQFEPFPVTDADLDRWDEWARVAGKNLKLGSFNWVAAMLSLTAEVRRLRAAAQSSR